MRKQANVATVAFLVSAAIAGCAQPASESVDVDADVPGTAEAALTDPCDIDLIGNWKADHPPAVGLSTSVANDIYDARVETFFADHPELTDNGRWPGLNAAVTKNGKLVFARSWGFKDRNNAKPLNIDYASRIGSVSKVATATAMMRLFDQPNPPIAPGDLVFDKLAPILGIDPDDPLVDPNFKLIQVRDLLTMTTGILNGGMYGVGGGWYSDEHCVRRWLRAEPPGDCHFNIPPPTPPIGSHDIPTAEDGLNYWIRNARVTFPHGRVYVYAGPNYQALAVLVAHLGGYADYPSALHALVLDPAKTRHMRPGLTPIKQRPWWEVSYTDVPNAALVQSVFNPSGPPVPAPEAYDLRNGWGSGGLIASPIDLMRFVNVIDDRSDPPDILSPTMLAWRNQSSFIAGLDKDDKLPHGTDAHCPCAADKYCVDDVDGVGWCLNLPSSDGWFGWGFLVHKPPVTLPSCSDADNHILPRFDFSGGVVGASAVIARSHDDSSWTYELNTQGGVDSHGNAIDYGPDIWNTFFSAYADTNCGGGFDVGDHDLFTQLDHPYSPWQGKHKYQTKADTESSHGRYPVRVEGRYTTAHGEQFHALFGKLPAGWTARSVNGWTCDDFRPLMHTMKSDDYQMTSLQWFMNNADKRARFQATWILPEWGSP